MNTRRSTSLSHHHLLPSPLSSPARVAPLPRSSSSSSPRKEKRLHPGTFFHRRRINPLLLSLKDADASLSSSSLSLSTSREKEEEEEEEEEEEGDPLMVTAREFLPAAADEQEEQEEDGEGNPYPIVVFNPLLAHLVPPLPCSSPAPSSPPLPAPPPPHAHDVLPSPSVSPCTSPRLLLREKEEEIWPDVHDEEQDPAIAASWPDLSSQDEDIRLHVERTGQILVRAITWNQQAQAPPSPTVLRQKLLPHERYHVYVVGTQECEHSIATSVVIQSSKSHWEKALRKTLGPRYQMLLSHSLQAAHLTVFVHKALTPFLTDLRSAAVPCGLLANSLGNKGGIGITFRLFNTTFLFVTAHLAAGQRAVNLRHADYHRIAEGLRRSFSENMSGEGPSSSAWSSPSASSSPSPPQQQRLLTDAFDHVLFMGDCNYRIANSRAMVDALLAKNIHSVLRSHDQLIQAMKAREAFVGFAEGPLNFRPTYKFDKGTSVYDSGPKQRVPAWTDRVLYKSHEGIRVLSYQSVPELRMSDHRPVVASFQMQVDVFGDCETGGKEGGGQDQQQSENEGDSEGTKNIGVHANVSRGLACSIM